MEPGRERGSEYDSAPTSLQQGDTEQLEQLPGQALGQAWARTAPQVLAGAWRPAPCSAPIISFNCHGASFSRRERTRCVCFRLACCVQTRAKEEETVSSRLCLPVPSSIISSLRSVWGGNRG